MNKNEVNDTQGLREAIEAAYERRAEINPASATAEVKSAVGQVMAGLNSGRIRVAEKKGAEWVVNEWVKKATLLSFRLRDSAVMEGGYTHYFDKLDSKFANFSQADFAAAGFRVVPPATVRDGAHIAKNVILMPSFVNIGAFV